MISQKEAILEYLGTGASLTVLDALTRFGCYALSQRIGELEREGISITHTMIDLPNGKRVCSYKLAIPCG